MSNKYSLSDPYLNHGACIDRLIREYNKHKRLIIAVDFDDTVFAWTASNSKHDLVLDLVRRCKKLGFYIVLFTASDKSRYEFMTNYMREKRIEVDSINKNPIDLPYGHNGKIYYNHFLCDRAGLPGSYHILERVVHEIELKLNPRIVLQAPQYLNDFNYSTLNSIFLAGSISNAAEWQPIAIEKLKDKFDLFNPRRDDFDTFNKEMEYEQIKWEYDHLKHAKQVIFWFSPETFAPITLFELGNFMDKAKYIGVHPDYKRKDDVRIQLSLRDWDGIIVDNLDQLLEYVYDEV